MFSFVLTISICGALFSILLPHLSGTLRHFICTGSSIQYNQRFPCNDFSSVCSLELDRNCQLDFTAVYDGASTATGLLGKVCGLAQPTFESSSNVLTVVLSTDDANSYRGFSAQYSTAPLPGPTEPNSECPCYMERMLIIFIT